MSEESATETETKTEEQAKPTEESNEPAENSSRFKEVYGKMKNGERENQSLQAQMLTIQSESKRTNELLSSFISKTDQSKHEEMLAQSEAQLDAAREEDPEIYKKALSNYKKIVTAINEKPKPESSSEDNSQAMTDFKAYNPWYGTNQEMTGRAHTIDSEMKSDPYWKAQSGNVFLAEVARRTVNNSSKPQNQTLGPGSIVDGVGESMPEDQIPVKKGLSNEEKVVLKRIMPNYSEKDAIEGILKERQKMAEQVKEAN